METIWHEAWIEADQDAVFDALTTQEGLDGWWGKVVSAEARVGHVVEFDHGHGDLLRMRITELVPGERVDWKCVSDFVDPLNPASEWLGTRLSFTLRTERRAGVGSLLARHVTRDEFTIVDFRHTGWAPGARWFAFCNLAWGVTLESALKKHCESGAAT